MDLITAIEKRISVRKFKDDPIDKKDLSEIIRLAGYAPSINNYQPWKYYVIKNKDILRKMAIEITKEIAKMPESESRMAGHIKNQAAWFSTFFQESPVLIALAVQPYEIDLEKGVKMSRDELDRIKNYPDLQSSGASIQNLLLSATAKGYGTCWMTGPLYAQQKIEELLNIKEPWKLVSFVALGVPDDEKTKPKTKRDLSKEMILID